MGLLSLAAVLAMGSPGALQLTPAWQGLARAGAVTELTIDFTPRVGGAAEIEVVTAVATAYLGIDTEGGQPVSVTLPARVGADGGIVVTARVGGEIPLSAGVELSTGSAVVAWVSRAAAPAAAELGAAHRLLLQPRSLPASSQAYESVDLLVIDASRITGLNAVQANALQEYAAGCGRLLVVNDWPAQARELHRLTGCNGQSAMISDTADAAVAATKLLRTIPTPMPDGAALATLASDPAQRTWRQALLFMLTYLLLWALVARYRSTPWLLALPVLAVATGAAAWQGRQPATGSVMWVEYYAGDATARTRRVDLVAGSGTLTSPVDSRDRPRLPRCEGPVALNWDWPANRAPALRIEQPWLSTLRLVDDSVTATVARLELQVTGARPVVRNPGPASTGPALLVWDDGRYNIPALAPGATWTPASAPVAWPAADIDRLARQRAMRHTATVLQNLTGTECGDPGVDQCWRLVIAPSGPS